MAERALLIIDIQSDYFPGGKMELEGAEAAAENAGLALDQFRRLGLPVFHVKHLSTRPGATFFIPGTPGVEIHPRVRARAGERVLEKNFPNSFRGTELDAALKAAGAKELVVAGMMTHMCVDASVRQAADLGYRVTLLGDACATRTQSYGGETIPARHVHAAFLAALNGFYAKVINAREL
ncbi:MAG TPA: cysteine hydrolase family protein [Burkholderiales bacterium]|nr:cysteine hydrolase family protein [Burkholderiales bacterium]